MLGIRKVGRDRADYYLSDLASELPLAMPASWTGAASGQLGLEGTLVPEAFHLLLQGRHPRTGQPMGSGRNGVAAFDLTFSAPKSASVLFALGGVEAASRVAWTHTGAVHGALRYLEQHGVTATRQSRLESVVVPTTGVIAGQFTHAVSRNGDPHLHSARRDGEPRPRRGRPLGRVRPARASRRTVRRHRRSTGALRAGLTAAFGVRWAAPPGRPSEIMGVAPELLGEFSSRAADIRRSMHEAGARSSRAARVAWAATRPAKPPPASYGELARVWARRARAVGGTGGLELPVGRLPPGRGCSTSTASLRSSRSPPMGAPSGATSWPRSPPLHPMASRRSPRAPRRPVGAHAVLGVAEPLHHRRDVVPANHLLRALGPRPLTPKDHALWVGAAEVLNAYRGRWGNDRAAAAIGVPGSLPCLWSLPAARLADHIRTARRVEEVRSRLGLR